MIMDTPFFKTTDPTPLESGHTYQLDITPTYIEQLLQYVTISLVTLGLDKKLTSVENRFFVNAYDFGSKEYIYGPYMTTLGIATIILVIGTLALWRNGVPAEDSFLNIVCATRVSETMDTYAKGAANGGVMSIPQELKDMNLAFGETLEKTERAVGEGKLAGFGAPGEVQLIFNYAELKKGSWGRRD